MPDLAGERSSGWWETCRAVLPSPLLGITELEHHATALRPANTPHVPGLLQPTDHAREISRQMVPEPGPALVDAEAELEAYRLLLARMEAVALTPDESRDFIHSLIADQ
ncbi:hypothetical protein [Streptomyces sp. NPDC001880]